MGDIFQAHKILNKIVVNNACLFDVVIFGLSFLYLLFLSAKIDFLFLS